MKSFIIIALLAALPGAVLAQTQVVAPQAAREVRVVQRVQLAQAPQPGKLKGTEVEADVKKFITEATGLVRLTGEDPRIDVDLENAGLKEALKQIFERAKLEYRVDDDVSSDTKVSLRAKNVRFLTALEFVLQSADAGLTREVRDGKAGYRIRKGGSSDPFGAVGLFRSNGLTPYFTPDGKKGQLPTGKIQEYLKTFPNNNTLTPYLFKYNEQRSTFRCPHCKGQSTVLSRPQQPKCEKCSRVFQPDWQFCPADGAKRPAAAAEWRYCPFCGKRTEGDKSGADTGDKGQNPLGSFSGGDIGGPGPFGSGASRF